MTQTGGISLSRFLVHPQPPLGSPGPAQGMLSLCQQCHRVPHSAPGTCIFLGAANLPSEDALQGLGAHCHSPGTAAWRKVWGDGGSGALSVAGKPSHVLAHNSARTLFCDFGLHEVEQAGSSDCWRRVLAFKWEDSELWLCSRQRTCTKALWMSAAPNPYTDSRIFMLWMSLSNWKATAGLTLDKQADQIVAFPRKNTVLLKKPPIHSGLSLAVLAQGWVFYQLPDLSSVFKGCLKQNSCLEKVTIWGYNPRPWKTGSIFLPISKGFGSGPEELVQNLSLRSAASVFWGHNPCNNNC